MIGWSNKIPKWPWNNFIINTIARIYKADLEHINIHLKINFNYEKCKKMFLIEETSF